MTSEYSSIEVIWVQDTWFLSFVLLIMTRSTGQCGGSATKSAHHKYFNCRLRSFWATPILYPSLPRIERPNLLPCPESSSMFWRCFREPYARQCSILPQTFRNQPFHAFSHIFSTTTLYLPSSPMRKRSESGTRLPFTSNPCADLPQTFHRMGMGDLGTTRTGG